MGKTPVLVSCLFLGVMCSRQHLFFWFLGVEHGNLCLADLCLGIPPKKQPPKKRTVRSTYHSEEVTIKFIKVGLGLSPLPVTVANEGLGWDPLLKM